MNKTFLSIAALIVVVSIGTSLIVTSQSGSNQVAAVVPIRDTTPIENEGQCYSQYYVHPRAQDGKEVCEYSINVTCLDDNGDITSSDFFVYQTLPPQTGYNSGPVLAEGCLPPMTPVEPIPGGSVAVDPKGSWSVDKNDFNFTSGYPKKLSDKEEGEFIKEEFGMSKDAYLKLLPQLVAPTSAQILKAIK